MEDAANKGVLITGGASGIGRLMALDFARRGARVTVWDLNREALEALNAESAAEGFSLTAAVCDVSDRAAVYREAERLLAGSGPVDILINNAGLVNGQTLLNIPDEKVEAAMAVNALALFWTVKAFLPSMLKRNSGRIVTVASAAGLIGVRGLTDYCAGKFAAVGFNEALRMELARPAGGIKTTLICPFFIDTGMFQGVKTRFPLLLPILKSEDVAKRAVKAVLAGKKRLILPPFVYSIFWLRLLPQGIMDWVAGFFGVNHAMDEFTGRAAPESGRPGETRVKRKDNE
ncbi:MAG: SDR family oxidoreductase [Treponema sp.]|jgi:all-trans-retinol dehydrogenase (NAD+)|nr:SDR family oxidoreductase [Treponema sp.]